jgi:hypothetical protein
LVPSPARPDFGGLSRFLFRFDIAKSQNQTVVIGRIMTFMKRREYHEGSKAKDNFERTMVALFKAPKTARAARGAKKKAFRSAGRAKKSGRGDKG